MPEARIISRTYGPAAVERRTKAHEPTIEGARAALECFYYALNRRSLDSLEAVLSPDPLVSMNNPLGGIMRGLGDLRSLYQWIFTGPARVWVEFYDVVEYEGRDTVVFAGRERGECVIGETVIPLAIRTTRVFQYLGGQHGWRQAHHHGSIDNPSALARYQRAVRRSGLGPDAPGPI